MKNTILVTSATGTVGSEVVKKLLDRDVQVLAAAHLNGNPKKKQKLQHLGVEIVELDYRQPKSLDAAFAQAGKVMMITPYAPDQVQIAGTIVDAAKRNGVSHLVVLSGFNVEDENKIQIGQALADSEELVKKSGITYTFLRACSFMQNFINYYGPQPDGNIYLPIGNSRMNFVDVRDIAELAAVALTTPGHENKVYRLATTTLSIAEIAQLLSRNTGKQIAFVDVPAEAIRSGMEQAGVPGFMIEGNLELFAACKEGRYDKTSDDFTKVTGRVPISFAQFANDYKIAFAYVQPEAML